MRSYLNNLRSPLALQPSRANAQQQLIQSINEQPSYLASRENKNPHKSGLNSAHHDTKQTPRSPNSKHSNVVASA